MDPKYVCSNCQRTFTVRAMVAKYGRPITCPGCGNTNTNKIGCIIRQRPQEPAPEKPPTKPQLDYIHSLNGDCRRVHTLKEAGEYITRLKKLKTAE